MNILILGGSGFIGACIAEQLVASGHRVTVPTRRRESAKQVGMLPTCDVIEASIFDAAALTALVAGHDAVINLVGILHGNSATAGAPYGSDWQRAHVALTELVVKACAQSGVQRYLHMSALGADSAGPSMYQRSKGDGEAVVKQSSLRWTIFRPSVVFGANDKFLNLFASLQALAPVVPLAGANCKFQPVHVADVAAAFVRALCEPAYSASSVGNTYELVGPETFSLKQLVQIAGQAAGHSRLVFGIPDFAGRAQALAMKLAFLVLPGNPPLSADNLDSMKTDNVASPNSQGFAALGITPQRLSAVAPQAIAERFSRNHYSRMRDHAGR
jgi:uncharacterized protein YbjT (DUF2867 family)